MKQRKLQISYLLLATLVATSCSNENDPVNPIDKTDAVELGITAGVSLTKSAINGDNAAQSGTGTDVMQSVAVYAGNVNTGPIIIMLFINKVRELGLIVMLLIKSI